MNNNIMPKMMLNYRLTVEKGWEDVWRDY